MFTRSKSNRPEFSRFARQRPLKFDVRPAALSASPQLASCPPLPCLILSTEEFRHLKTRAARELGGEAGEAWCPWHVRMQRRAGPFFARTSNTCKLSRKNGGWKEFLSQQVCVCVYMHTCYVFGRQTRKASLWKLLAVQHKQGALWPLSGPTAIEMQARW